LVTTITKIVGVVPTPLRVLLAALAALALAFALRSRLTALRARRLEHQRAELLEDVGLLQAALLPTVPHRLGPVETSASYRPADGPGAGGDFYDVFALEDGQIAVLVGDVSGHGRQALPHTALLRFTLRAYLEAGLSPRMAVQTAGTVLERQLGGSFATVIAATYHPRDRVLTYACAGHPPPLVLGSQPLHAVTVSAAPPIGVGMLTGTRQTTVAVPGGARICFHTDGVTEARVGGELYGADRLERTLGELGEHATASDVLARVTEQTDARPDDMAACVLNIAGAAAAPTLLSEELELDREQATSGRTERFLRAHGVEPEETAELMCSAHAAAGRTGTVMLELNRAGDGRSQVVVRRENVAHLQQPRTTQRIGLGASL
jgi:serine phosphatase RsbU (regulator of sigma subunit)